MTPQVEAILGHLLGAVGLIAIGLLVWHAVMSWQPRIPDPRDERRRRGLKAANDWSRP